MIIDARSDVVTLSGRLEKNVWPSIQAAAQLLLRQHSNGILIEASQITFCSPEGARTFLDALAYIERHRARIVLCQAPECVMSVIRAVPGARSQVPIAPTCEEARASLDLQLHARTKWRSPRGGDGEPPTVFVPVLQGTLSIKSPLAIAHSVGCEVVHEAAGDRQARVLVKPLIRLSYVLVVPRSIPLNTPQPDEEADARKLLKEAEDFALLHGLEVSAYVARTRDAGEEIVDLAQKLHAAKIVIGIPQVVLERVANTVVRTVLEKAPCEVLMTKKEMD
jgi:nucleotide-binding universal stress UspA family protein/anti-anti-sigma regulatory factor